MSLTKQELLDMQEEVAEAKNTVAELVGQDKALMKQLKDDWDCGSIEVAEKKLTTLEKANATLQKEKEAAIEEVEEKYPYE